MTKGGFVVNTKGEVHSTSGKFVSGRYVAEEVTDFQDGAYMASLALTRVTADNVSEFLKQ